MLASEIRILDAGRLIAVHPVLAGRDRRSLLPSHRRQPKGTSLAGDDDHLCGQPNRWGPRLSDGSIPADPAELRSLARPCPRCGTRMIVIERFERGVTPHAPPPPIRSEGV